MKWCEPCNRSFGSQDALDPHLGDSPAHAPSYDCEPCNRSFGSQAALDQHLGDSPAHALSYDCEPCNRSFGSQDALDRHLGDSPVHALSYDCEPCNRSFGSQDALDRHLYDSPAHFKLPRTPLNIFFQSFNGFVYDPTLPPRESYSSLQMFYGWHRGEDESNRESGMTSTFEHRPRPTQCYNCQEVGHKAFQCKNVQKCARCAAEGHRHSDCNQTVLKCVPCGGPHESIARIAGSSIRRVMSKTFRIIQLNVRKQGGVHDSLMNDEETQGAAVLAIQEPQARRIHGRLLTTPMGHDKWTKMVPSTWREGRWAIRSMLWVNKDIEAEQVAIESPDLTAAVIRLPERLIFMASVKAVAKVRRDTGAVVEVMVVGDFNRHDQLWGGDEVSLGRQGEADPIIDLMNELALSSLLKRGTKTWHGGGQSGDCESTIDLVLASDNLTESMIKCAIHGTEHGSDHRAIETVLDAPWSAPKHQERLLLKNAPWKEINARIASALTATPSGGTVQQKTDRLMTAVSEAVHALTPKAKKPSLHAKRWWTADLRQLRHIALSQERVPRMKSTNTEYRTVTSSPQQ
ncbi:hypothetical protein N7489_003625 [Penicillium chrysogenum]|uniref:Zinc finger protein n=1 Tax=Penicillium chrysogenum TaxID=5076 RepID=A0ABQ8WA51_PENCH|nr:uncharacterized protein N7489_003625 [Penicillium chrysogenum]KAJ5253215.1 hypothetical protein N7489_003625 [Penicillium chrysogenum]KAJ5260431.1 hypothetical protein N7505_009812 [Penicillium chrysogenum]KAJ6137042.1 hypothetical protein N7497_012294 [Penicillium chrysogenum]